MPGICGRRVLGALLGYCMDVATGEWSRVPVLDAPSQILVAMDSYQSLGSGHFQAEVIVME